MTVELTTDAEAIVSEKVQSGLYETPEQVILEALQQFVGGHAILPPRKQTAPGEWAALFAELDAAGAGDFVLERDMRPAEEREWL